MAIKISEARKFIRLKLNDFKIAIEQKNKLNNYPDTISNLLEHVILYDMQEEYRFLYDLVTKDIDSIELLKAQITNRCAIRAKELNGTMLDFSVNPDHYTNNLYREIVKKIFKPDTVLDYIQIMSPATKYFLRVTLPDKLPIQKSEYSRQVRLKALKELRNILNIEEIELIPKNEKEYISADIREYIISGRYLFWIRDIAHLTFEKHVEIYKSLFNFDQILHGSIYSYNGTLRQLKDDIQWIGNEGRTPRQMLERLRMEFIWGGESKTANKNASVQACLAWKAFQVEFGTLAPIIQAKLRKMSNKYGLTLTNIIDDLNSMGCVETAAFNIKQILDNECNQSILDQRTELNEKRWHDTKSSYKLNTPTTGSAWFEDSDNQCIPPGLLSKCIETIAIESFETLIIILTNQNPDAYDQIMSSIKLHSPYAETIIKNLLSILKTGLLNQEQVASIAKAIPKYIARFVPNENILPILSEANNEVLLLSYFKSISPKEILNNHFTGRENTVNNLVPLFEYRDVMRYLFKSIANQTTLFKLLLSKNQWGNSIIHKFVQYPDNIMILFDYFPDELISKLLSNRNAFGEPVFFNLMKDECNYQLFVNLSSSSLLKKCLILKDQEGCTIIHVLFREQIKNRYEVLKTIPKELLPDKLLQHNNAGDTLFHTLVIEKQKNDFIILLNCLKKKQQCKLFKTQNIYGDTLLHISKNVEWCFKLILLTFSKEDRYALITKENKFGFSVLESALKHHQLLFLILKLLPQNDILRILKKPYFSNRKNIIDLKLLIKLVNKLSGTPLSIFIDIYIHNNKCKTYQGTLYQKSFLDWYGLLNEINNVESIRELAQNVMRYFTEPCDDTFKYNLIKKNIDEHSEYIPNDYWEILQLLIDKWISQKYLPINAKNEFVEQQKNIHLCLIS